MVSVSTSRSWSTARLIDSDCALLSPSTLPDPSFARSRRLRDDPPNDPAMDTPNDPLAAAVAAPAARLSGNGNDPIAVTTASVALTAVLATVLATFAPVSTASCATARTDRANSTARNAFSAIDNAA